MMGYLLYGSKFDIEEPEKIITKNNTNSFYDKFKKEYEFSQENTSFDTDFKFKTKLIWINETENSFRDPCSTAMWKIEILQYSLLGACRVLGKNAEKWLTYTLKYIGKTKTEDLHRLLPEEWDETLVQAE